MSGMRLARLWFAVLAAGLAGCTGLGGGERPTPEPPAQARSGGGYYQDDGPPESSSRDLSRIPDAVPRPERPCRACARPYEVLGVRYVPMASARSYVEEGVASWYGRQFHGRPTSTGEPYDMFAMSAAHPTLPLPSYARVTHLQNGRSVTVRVNDRGPFLHGRLIDLSYAAAMRLDMVGAGSAPVRVEALDTESPQVATAPRRPPPATDLPAGSRPVAAGAVSAPEPAAMPAVPPATREPETMPVRASAPKLATAGPGAQETAGGTGDYVLQAGAFTRHANALALAGRLREAGLQPVEVASGGSDALHRVRLGPLQGARLWTTLSRLSALGIEDPEILDVVAPSIPDPDPERGI